MDKLTILFDPYCEVCVRCRGWLLTQPSFVPLELLSCYSPEARARYGRVPWLGAELVVVSNEGDVWVGPAAFLVCLWALVDYRDWSYSLSGDALAPLAERFFRMVSSKRTFLASMLGRDRSVCPGAACGSGRHVPSAPR